MVAHRTGEKPSAETRASAPGPPPQVDDALARAAQRALERHGLGRTSLERIAEEAGVSRVTLYRRGLTRDAILAALAGTILDAYREAVFPALTARGTGGERLRRALAAVCEVAEERLELLLALRDRIGAGLPAGVAEDGGLSRKGFTEPVERLLQDGAADGSLREVDVRETAVALLNLVPWTYVHLRTDARWSARRARRVTLELGLHGVASPGG